MLSPYLCFISFLYLDLYVLGDDALISYGSFMQNKHLYVLIYIFTKGEVGALFNRFKPFSKIFLLTILRRCFFSGSYICYFCLVLLCFHVRLFADVLWSRSEKRADLFALVCDV